MTQNRDLNIDLNSFFQEFDRELCALAEKHHGDRLFLLSLLRNLEQIHRHIRVNYFETALPQTRHDLYKFVKDIEEKGGWPYIERMRLKELLQNIEPIASETDLERQSSDRSKAE